MLFNSTYLFCAVCSKYDKAGRDCETTGVIYTNYRIYQMQQHTKGNWLWLTTDFLVVVWWTMQHACMLYKINPFIFGQIGAFVAWLARAKVIIGNWLLHCCLMSFKGSLCVCLFVCHAIQSIIKEIKPLLHVWEWFVQTIAFVSLLYIPLYEKNSSVNVNFLFLQFHLIF